MSKSHIPPQARRPRRLVTPERAMLDSRQPEGRRGRVIYILPGRSQDRIAQRALLAEIAQKATIAGHAGAEWDKVGQFLAQQYQRQILEGGAGKRS